LPGKFKVFIRGTGEWTRQVISSDSDATSAPSWLCWDPCAIKYLDSPYASISAEELLALFDRVVRRRIYDDAEDNELADLMDAWTGNDFRVVIMSEAYDNRSAYRAGTLEQQTQLGRNLYVHWKAIGQSKTSGGHWESMRRRATPRPDPSDAAGPSSS
jgi:hypothetical protein